MSNTLYGAGNKMSFFIAVVIIIVAYYMPGPTGVFWPALLVAIPGLIVGSNGKFNLLWFSLGSILGSIIIVVLNFEQWASMAVVLSVLQIIPVFAAITSFIFGWTLFGSLKRQKQEDDTVNVSDQ